MKTIVAFILGALIGSVFGFCLIFILYPGSPGIEHFNLEGLRIRNAALAIDPNVEIAADQKDLGMSGTLNRCNWVFTFKSNKVDSKGFLDLMAQALENQVLEENWSIIESEEDANLVEFWFQKENSNYRIMLLNSSGEADKTETRMITEIKMLQHGSAIF